MNNPRLLPGISTGSSGLWAYAFPRNMAQAYRNGVMRNARHFLYRNRMRRVVSVLGAGKILRQNIRRKTVDYTIAGILAGGLLLYLLYTLLRPERF
ncbi:MAG: K(+)-transporting ATPase subunit F [Acidobacteriota bacterium]|nr:K(+)-transporting ATPase subunit F [Acidobacteriota bacterium]